MTQKNEWLVETKILWKLLELNHLSKRSASISESVVQMAVAVRPVSSESLPFLSTLGIKRNKYNFLSVPSLPLTVEQNNNNKNVSVTKPNLVGKENSVTTLLVFKLQQVYLKVTLCPILRTWSVQFAIFGATKHQVRLV